MSKHSSGGNMRILIVDDDYVSRVKLKSLMSDFGDCDSVPNGQLAIEMFKLAYEEQLPYDLITMDIVMPDMDGKDVVAAIRDWELKNNVIREGHEVQILMISNMSDGKNIFTSFKRGAEWYLRKPINPDKLTDAIKNMGFDI